MTTLIITLGFGLFTTLGLGFAVGIGKYAESKK